MTGAGTMKNHLLLYIAALAIVVTGYLFQGGSTVEIDLQVPAPGVLQVFWKGYDSGYAEERSAKILVRPGQERYRLPLVNTLLLDSLRIDPFNGPGIVRISRLAISQLGVTLVELTPADGLARLQPGGQVTALSLRADGLHFTSMGKDPQFEMRVRSLPLTAAVIAGLLLLALILHVLVLQFFRMSRLAVLHSRGERRSFRSFVAYLAMSVFSVLFFLALCLLAGEYGLRWYYRDVLSTSRVTYFYNRSLGKFMSERNALGFRGKQFEISKGDVFRIVVIGDSFAWGQGVLPYTDRFPEVFAAKLAETYPDRRFEVINMALAGMNLIQHNQFQKFTLQLEPDYVLYQWYVNDMETTREGAAFKTPTLVPRALHTTLIEHSVIYFLLQDVYREIRVATGKQQTYTAYMVDKLKDPASPGAVEAQKLLDKLATGFSSRGVPFGIVLFPEFSGLRDNPLGFLQERVLSYCTEKQLQCLDLTPAYLPYQDRMLELWANRFDAHPSKLAHRIAADEIFAVFGETWGRMAAEKQAY